MLDIPPNSFIVMLAANLQNIDHRIAADDVIQFNLDLDWGRVEDDTSPAGPQEHAMQVGADRVPAGPDRDPDDEKILAWHQDVAPLEGVRWVGARATVPGVAADAAEER